eukprot:TRINITY_DN1582_c0_g2_i12.p1 TRINITY_DN1582_c0_g2~~TRINITY_DN1582_c0_g2_i12.p1  ORF type:complete len:260 (-),score=22.21 TRINITY_DN1582_c0_g2_i12:1065-1844(-)
MLYLIVAITIIACIAQEREDICNIENAVTKEACNQCFVQKDWEQISIQQSVRCVTDCVVNDLVPQQWKKDCRYCSLLSQDAFEDCINCLTNIDSQPFEFYGCINCENSRCYQCLEEIHPLGGGYESCARCQDEQCYNCVENSASGGQASGCGQCAYQARLPSSPDFDIDLCYSCVNDQEVPPDNKYRCDTCVEADKYRKPPLPYSTQDSCFECLKKVKGMNWNTRCALCSTYDDNPVQCAGCVSVAESVTEANNCIENF